MSVALPLPLAAVLRKVDALQFRPMTRATAEELLAIVTAAHRRALTVVMPTSTPEERAAQAEMRAVIERAFNTARHTSLQRPKE